jgi:alpha-1,3-mannosyltransferase
VTARATRPRRILHVTRRSFPLPGGIERYVLGLAIAQAKAGHRVSIMTLDIDVLRVRPGRLPASELVEGVRVIRLRGVGAQRFAATIRPDKVVRAVADSDVVHLHDLRFMTGTVAMTAALAKRPLVFHTHGLLYHTPFATRLKHLLMRWYYGPLLRVAGAWAVASSEPDRDMLLADVPELRGRTVTFENALDLAPLSNVTRNPDAGLVVVTGRVAHHKGIDDLLAALALIPDIPWRLEVAGTEDRGERHRLDALVARLGIGGRVRFAGEYTDAEHLDRLSRASAAAFPSRAEGFGLALLEALAAGVPVVARDQPAHRDVLGPDLEGHLVDFDDHAAAAAALQEALALSPEDAAVLGQQERDRASIFDLPRLVDELDRLYGRIISRA